MERYLNVAHFPTYRLVDKNGRVLDVNADPRDLDALENVIKQLGK